MEENWKSFFDRYQYYIFDFDGTLVDSMWMWAELDRELLGARGLALTSEVSQRVKTLSIEAAAEFFITYFKLPDSKSAIALEIVHRAREKYAKQIPLKPGVKQLLERCALSGKKMCIATASDRQNVEAICKKYDILKYFSFLFTADEVPEGKTGPDIFLQCAKRFQVKPEEVLVLEDTVHAAEVAETAGFPVLGVYDDWAASDWPRLQQICDAFCEKFV